MAEKKIDPASAPPTPAEVSVMVQGDKIVFQTDMANAFYTYDKDTAGQSACDDKCAEAWPPVIVDSADLPAGLDANVFSVVDRADGSHQLKAGKWPLYHFAGDSAPGDVNGQGSGGVWFVLDPAAKLIK